MSRLNYFLFVGLTVLLMSCMEQPFYEKVYDFKGQEWKQDQKAVFRVDIKDTTKSYRFVLNLRTTTDYPNENIWLFWHSKTPDNKSVREPFEIKIANPDGSFIGKSSGTVIENQLTFADKKFPAPGKYVFTIEQAVTVPVVKEVLDLGLTIYKQK